VLSLVWCFGFLKDFLKKWSKECGKEEIIYYYNTIVILVTVRYRLISIGKKSNIGEFVILHLYNITTIYKSRDAIYKSIEYQLNYIVHALI
jgi:hypothetical protein